MNVWKRVTQHGKGNSKQTELQDFFVVFEKFPAETQQLLF